MAKIDNFIIGEIPYEIVPEIAPLFSTDTVYHKGDCVIYNAVLYKFTANHAAGDWTGNDVEAFEVADRLNKISDSVALEFNASTSYTAGQYVYKNGVLYRFTSDHIGAWSDADAEVVTVGGELTRLTDDIKSVSGGITVVDAIEKMTDTSLTYLLSINKHWYFYNGSSWEDGGLFNGSEVPEAIIRQIIAAYIANHTTPMKTLTIKDSGGNVIGVFDGSANAIVTINNVTYDDGNEVDY